LEKGSIEVFYIDQKQSGGKATKKYQPEYRQENSKNNVAADDILVMKF